MDNHTKVITKPIAVVDDGALRKEDLLLRRFIISSDNLKVNKQYTNKDKNYPNFHFVSVTSLNYSTNGMSVYSTDLFTPYKDLWSTFLDFPPNEAGFIHRYGLLRFNLGKIKDKHPEIQTAFNEDTKDEHLGRRNSHCLFGLLTPPSKEERAAEKLWIRITTQISSMNPFYEDPSGLLHPGEFLS